MIIRAMCPSYDGQSENCSCYQVCYVVLHARSLTVQPQFVHHIEKTSPLYYMLYDKLVYISVYVAGNHGAID